MSQSFVKLFQFLPRPFRRHKILRAIAALSGPIQKVRVNREFDAYIDLRDGFARLVAIEDEFETEFISIAEKLFPPAGKITFFDVGANYGLMSLAVATKLPERLSAYLFEANPHLCRIISKSLGENSRLDLHSVEAAVMNSSGAFSLSFDMAHTGAGYVQQVTHGGNVQGIVLDDYLENTGIERVTLLKVDVEGNETAVFQGAEAALRDGRIGAIYFEYCPKHLARSGNPLDPIAFLRELGWEVFHCRTFDTVASVKYEIGGSQPLRLHPVGQPESIRITDLLAFPGGTARKVSSAESV